MTLQYPSAQAYVFDTVLQLAADPIAAVRLQLLELLPRLKQSLRLPDHVDKLVRRYPDHPSLPYLLPSLTVSWVSFPGLTLERHLLRCS